MPEKVEPPKDYSRRDFLHLTGKLMVGGVVAKVLGSTPARADEKQTERTRVAQATPVQPQVRGNATPSVATQPTVTQITQEDFQRDFAYMFDSANQYRTTTDPMQNGGVIEFDRWRIEPDTVLWSGMRYYSAVVKNRVQMGDVPPDSVIGPLGAVSIGTEQYRPMNFQVGTFDIMVTPHAGFVTIYYFDSATGRSGVKSANFTLVGPRTLDSVWGAEITPEGVGLVAADATAIVDGQLKPSYSLAQVFLEPKSNGDLDIYIDLFGITGE